MKKFITFPNFVAFIGILALALGFIPSIAIFNAGEETAYVNIFIATFGGAYTIFPGGDVTKTCYLEPCAGMIVCLCLAVVAIALTILKFKIKGATLFATPFYLASAILLCNAKSMIYNASYHGIAGAITGAGIDISAATIAIIVLLFVCAAFALFDFISTIAASKPKSNKKSAY